MKKCEDCKFYYQHKKEFFGYCRRFPPSITKVVGDIVQNLFPMVTRHSNCGEFRKRK